MSRVALMVAAFAVGGGARGRGRVHDDHHGRHPAGPANQQPYNYGTSGP